MVKYIEARPYMDELVKLLRDYLRYVSHEIIDDTMFITVESTREVLNCPFCNKPSDKAHSHYSRSFQDLPIQGYKVIVLLNNRKMFCYNPECSHTTFAEVHDFIAHKGKKTKRLEDEIIKLALNVSSVTASNILSDQIVTVGKSTICNLLKKRNTNI